jgi:chemotaxis protein MotB
VAKKKAEAHHGGAWKVAYADFVTAMMALFMVLWICAQDKKILLYTSKYFKQPFNAVTKESVGLLEKEAGGSTGGSENESDKTTAANLAFLQALATDLSRLINMKDVMEEKAVELQVTSDALKITLYDRTRHAIFKPGSAEMTEWGRLVMQNLAWTIERNRLKVYIDGHAAQQSLPGDGDGSYGPWELTADRANAARRLLVKYAVDPKMIERVSGFADTKPVPKSPGTAPGNERITISLSVNRS